MNYPSTFACVLLACAAGLPAPARAGDVPAMPVAAACPALYTALPERLYPAWRAIDSAAQVMVEFKLDGKVIHDIAVSGGHGDYVAHVRRAVRSLACQAGAGGRVAVRFRIDFVYPEDRPGAVLALSFVDQPRG